MPASTPPVFAPPLLPQRRLALRASLGTCFSVLVAPHLAALHAPARAEAARPAARASAPRPDAAVRLITVGGALTETVFALGLEHGLVGADSTSTHPAAAQQLPKVGYLRQLSAEGVLSLRPTAVLCTAEAGPPQVLQQLQAAGIRVTRVPANHGWQAVRDKVHAVGEVTGQAQRGLDFLQQLQARWQQTQALVHSLRQARLQSGRPEPRVVFLLAHGGTAQASGVDTAADALIPLCGARNPLAEAGGFSGYKPLSAESMALAAPDAILTTTESLQAIGGADALWQRPELRLTPAYAQRHARPGGTLLHLPALELLGFGPRLPQTVAHLARGLLT